MHCQVAVVCDESHSHCIPAAVSQPKVLSAACGHVAPSSGATAHALVAVAQREGTASSKVQTPFPQVAHVSHTRNGEVPSSHSTPGQVHGRPSAGGEDEQGAYTSADGVVAASSDGSGPESEPEAPVARPPQDGRAAR